MTSKAKPAVGYILLLVSAISFVTTRSLLIPLVAGDVDVVPTHSAGIPLIVLAIVAGFVGSWLLIPEHYLAVIAGILFVLIGLPTLVGSVLDLIDFVSATGSAGFGARIIILVGNMAVPIGTGLAVIIALACVIRGAVSRRSTGIHS